MAADSNTGFHRGTVPPSLYDRHVVSFQSAAVRSSSMMIPTGINGFSGGSNTTGMMLAGCPSGINNTNALIPAGSSTGSLLLDPVPGLRHDTGFAVDWSSEEQTRLEEGLVKYSDEPSIMRYIKIAAMLHSKTVRDVALRCRWMTKKENGKRRKPEEYYTGKKMKDIKEKLMVSTPRAIAASSQPTNMVNYPFMMHQMDTNNQISFEVPAIDNATMHLLEETDQLLGQIKVNLENSRLEDNIELFFRANINITSISNSLGQVPGIMSQMPPLSESINGELADAISLSTPMAQMFGTPGGIHMKQEPRR